MRTHDLIIIGGGSAGYAAARTARDAGIDVAIVDHGPLGGLCILRGCMPTKTILRSSEIMALMARAKEFGIGPVTPRAILSQIVDRKDRLVREFAEDRIKALHDTRFTLYQDHARFLSPTTIQVGTQTLTAKAFVLATGSVPNRLAIPGLQEVGTVTSDEILDLRTQPASLLVLGGGFVALELGQFFARIGTQVTILQRGSHLLSDLDEDLGRVVETAFREEGITVHTGTRFDRFSQEGSDKVAHVTIHGQSRTCRAEMILEAFGRRPNIDGLDLDAAGVRIEEGRVTVEADMRTSQPHIFAVGDVNDLFPIVHIAIQQGEVAGYNAVYPHKTQRRVDDRLNAQVVFTDPGVATVGLSEQDCRAQGIAYLAASYPFNDHGKSMCLGALHGHVKLLCRPDTGELLGAQIVGPDAGELIHELIAVMYYRGTVKDLARMPHYHPTLAEIVTYPAEELAAKVGSSNAS
jgi:pyruvate/2-oxoglutarate dehydrogenase complex dihydrolipoamide dehydrogenase (E3) component